VPPYLLTYGWLLEKVLQKEYKQKLLSIDLPRKAPQTLAYYLLVNLTTFWTKTLGGLERNKWKQIINLCTSTDSLIE
jgi:hypothetical protein